MIERLAAPHLWTKQISDCGLCGMIDRRGGRFSGRRLIESIRLMHERSNGLGGGFAGYGIYPRFPEHYALHIMYHGEWAKEDTEGYLPTVFTVDAVEPIPTQPHPGVKDAPLLWRYFVRLKTPAEDVDAEQKAVIEAVMHVNAGIEGAFVFSSGQNMGAFKAVGYAADIGEFFRLDEYEGYCWTAHARFPTNTQAWWGGAHPFCLLDYSIVHNGEISSYGINRRYLEQFGYRCTLHTDTEVMVYLFDLLVRRHKLPLELACKVIAAPFWRDIDRAGRDPGEAELLRLLRTTYASALVNGPFAVIFAFNGGMVGLNDRIKLRPLVAGESGAVLYIASEESALHVMCDSLERVWAPPAGEPVIGLLEAAGGTARTALQQQAVQVLS